VLDQVGHRLKHARFVVRRHGEQVRNPRADADHVRVVVLAGKRRGVVVPGQRGPDALDLVRGNRLAVDALPVLAVRRSRVVPKPVEVNEFAPSHCLPVASKN